MLPIVLTAQLNSEKLSQGFSSLQNSSSSKVHAALFAQSLSRNVGIGCMSSIGLVVILRAFRAKLAANKSADSVSTLSLFAQFWDVVMIQRLLRRLCCKGFIRAALRCVEGVVVVRCSVVFC